MFVLSVVVKYIEYLVLGFCLCTYNSATIFLDSGASVDGARFCAMVYIIVFVC